MLHFLVNDGLFVRVSLWYSVLLHESKSISGYKNYPSRPADQEP